MLAAQNIRDRLREHLGDERYGKFVMHVPSSDVGTRLLFWQERAWEKFVAENPDCSLTYSQLVEVFSACPINGAQVRRLRYHEMIAAWLHSATKSIEQFEECNMVSHEDLGDTAIAFGFQNVEWEKLKLQITDGDVLQEFKSPPDTWARLAGQQGIAIVRDGKVVDSIVTRLN